MDDFLSILLGWTYLTTNCFMLDVLDIVQYILHNGIDGHFGFVPRAKQMEFDCGMDN